MACSSIAECPVVTRKDAGANPAVPAKHRGISSFERTSFLQGEERGLSPRSSTTRRDGSLIAIALDCRSRRCGFNSHASRQNMIRSANGQAARFSPSKCEFKPRPDYQRPVAQLEERTSDTREVECSNHSWSTNFLGVAQLGQSLRFGTGLLQVQILLPRPIMEMRKAGVLIRFEPGEGLRAVRVRSSPSLPNNGEHSLMAKAPRCDRGRCRLKSGCSPQSLRGYSSSARTRRCQRRDMDWSSIVRTKRM